MERLVEALVEPVAVHEVREVGCRLPERHRIPATDGAEQRIGGQVLPYVTRGDGRYAPVLAHHGIPVVARRDTLGARHHVPQGAFDHALRPLDPFRLLRVAGGRAPQRCPEARQLMPDLCDPGLVVTEQEPRGGQEILVVPLVLDLRVGGVELVRRRGKQ